MVSFFAAITLTHIAYGALVCFSARPWRIIGLVCLLLE